jgi:hypothetical protein
VLVAAVQGIGGVFLETLDVTALTNWCHEHLGIEFEENP